MTFRLTNLLYLFALVAASLSAFGASGIWVAGGVLAFWVLLFYLPRPGCVTLFLIGVLFMFLLAMLYPTVEMRRYWPHTACLNNIRELTTAIINYDTTKGHLPGTGTSADGGPPHSWRVDILPQLDRQDVFDLYHVDEAWNSRRNQQLMGTSPIYFYDLYHCPEHHAPTETAYFAITGPRTVWGNGFDDVTDGLGNTILLMEASGHGTHWAEPKDLTFDEAVELLTTPLPADDSDGHRIDHGYFYKPSYVRNVTMCDGSAHSLQVPLPREAAVALLTANGGEQIAPEWLDRQSEPQLDYGRAWGFSLFVVLAVLPGVPRLRPWIWPVAGGKRQQDGAVVQGRAERRGNQ